MRGAVDTGLIVGGCLFTDACARSECAKGSGGKVVTGASIYDIVRCLYVTICVETISCDFVFGHPGTVCGVWC
jgi:hypothetical protein